MPYQFVPPQVEQMATDALEYLPNTELVTIASKGAYSAYEYTYRRGDDTAVFRLAYDFGMRLQESERGAALAAEAEKYFPGAVVIIPSIAEVETVVENGDETLQLSDVESPVTRRFGKGRGKK